MVRLEVPDWGGSGRPVILLAGGGNTAHVFDEFAPKLTDNCRVYGITRREFGASTYAPLNNGVDRLGEDVLAVIRDLKLNKPVLVGHSIAGVELSSVATLHPDSIGGVVYLEAAYPYAFDNGKGPTMRDFSEIPGPGQAPAPSESGLAIFRALQKWDAQVYGFQLPESEFRQTWDSTSGGRVTKQRDFPGSHTSMTIMTSSKEVHERSGACIGHLCPPPHARCLDDQECRPCYPKCCRCLCCKARSPRRKTGEGV